MKVVYNATSARVGGGLSYALGQLGGLTHRSDLHLTVYTAPWNDDAFRAALRDAFDLRLVSLSNVPMRFAWEQTALPWFSRGADVLVSPGNFASLGSPIPQVLVLQNPNYVGHGRQLPRNQSPRRRAKIGFSILSMRRAALVVSISNSLTLQAEREGWLSHVNMVTIKSGAPPVAIATGSDLPASSAARALVGEDPYVLTVANDYPHKRLDDLASLVRHLAVVDSVPRKVVIAGSVTSQRREALRSQAAPHGDDLVFLGSIADRPTVLDLYRQAAVTVSTSELEAWPLTLHEAGSQGSPLVLSDIPPHRELAQGNASAFVPVGDVAALVDAVRRAIGDPRPAPWTFDRTWADHGDELIEALRSVAR